MRSEIKISAANLCCCSSGSMDAKSRASIINTAASSAEAVLLSFKAPAWKFGSGRNITTPFIGL